MFKKKPNDTEARERFLEEARKHLGYRPRPGGISEFGMRVGYGGHDTPWSGAFVDCVARDAGIYVPACVYSPSGLAEFAYLGRLTFEPRPGDIAFFSFATDKDFGMMHVGIVNDVSKFQSHGVFECIEANANSGLGRAPKDRDGIYLRTRWKYETAGFGVPNFEARPGMEAKTQTDSQKLRLLDVQPGRKNKRIIALQRALEIKANLDRYTPGTFDGPTMLAYARWQRICGLVGSAANGEPEYPTLERLGRETGCFEVYADSVG